MLRSDDTVGGLRGSAGSGALSPWLRRFHPARPDAVRLVCLPHAGGAAPFFFPMSKAWSPAIDVLVVQYPGRQDRRFEPFVRTVEDMADLIATELRPLMDRPLALFGHSMGATIGYEVARRLDRLGRPALGLFASGRRAPSTYREEGVHAHDDATIIATLKQLSGTKAPALHDEEIVGMILPAIRADYRAVESYRHDGGPELTCPVSVLVGDDDPVTSVESARAWREHTSAACEVQVFRGGHFYLNDHAQQVVAVVERQVQLWAGRVAGAPSSAPVIQAGRPSRR